MKEEENRVVSLNAHKLKRDSIEKAHEWEESLPPPSQSFKNLIFLYPEELATDGREILFKRINSAAETNGQMVVISDCHYDRSGLYILFDELGGKKDNAVDIDDIIDSWSEQHRS
jgi:hypothetical protein